MNEKYYKVKVECLNCEYENWSNEKLEILKGQLVKDTPCPDCWTNSLIKKLKPKMRC